jgi:hypothetical protein
VARLQLAFLFEKQNGDGSELLGHRADETDVGRAVRDSKLNTRESIGKDDRRFTVVLDGDDPP